MSEKDRLAEFTAFRQRMNERILAEPNQVVRRFFALDTQTYKAGALDVKTKELLGLVASMVLRCDDCISYHVAQCKEAGVQPRGVLRDVQRRPGGGRLHRDPAPAPRGGFPRSAGGRRSDAAPSGCADHALSCSAFAQRICARCCVRAFATPSKRLRPGSCRRLHRAIIAG